MDRQRANGGLGEYYSEADTRTPTWLIAESAARSGELVGSDGRAADGRSADPEMVGRWLDDGVAPNGASGRAFTKGSVHGFDLTFAAPKSVSLLRALTDDIGEKVMRAAHLRAVDAAMTYLHQHAGYTRVHNPLTGTKDLQRGEVTGTPTEPCTSSWSSACAATSPPATTWHVFWPRVRRKTRSSAD